jgi:hypothetical protein
MALESCDPSMEGSVGECGCSLVWRLYTLGKMERNRNIVFPIAVVKEEISVNFVATTYIKVPDFGKQHCYCVKLWKEIGSPDVFFRGLNFASLAQDTVLWSWEANFC